MSTSNAASIVLTVLIPFIAAATGFGTNALALHMTFYPLKYHGFEIWGFRVLGWQGIVPSRARQMAEIAVDTITTRLLTVRDVFSRLDPKEFRERVEPYLEPVCARIFEAVLADVLDLETLSQLPSSVRQDYVRMLLEDAPRVVEGIIIDMQHDIEEVFDLKAVVTGVMLADVKLVVEIFQATGEQEFKFLRNSGAYFGFLFGLIQMGLWIAYSAWWILPIAGFLVGIVTNYLALYLIFNPINPVRFRGRKILCCGKPLQGLFLQRQSEVAQVYADVVQNRVLRAENLISGLHKGFGTKKLFQLISERVQQPIDDATSNLSGGLARRVVGDQTFDRARLIGATVVMRALPELMLAIDDYMAQALAVRELLAERLSNISAGDFERMLHPIFENDEWQLILVGGILGLIVGFIQVGFNELALL